MREGGSIRSIGVIGTPGCGKTTLCKALGLPTRSVRDLAESNACLGGLDDDGSNPVDVERLAKLFSKPLELTLIDGHLAHHLPVDALIVLRCEPSELEKRLSARGYSAHKIQSNVEVEMLGGPWPELIGDKRPIKEGAEGAIEWINAGCPPLDTPERAIDWLS